MGTGRGRLPRHPGPAGPSPVRQPQANHRRRSRAGDPKPALVGQARLALAKAALAAPIAGRVEEKNFSPGEFVPAGAPVLTLLDDTHLWLYAYVPENELNLVHVGQKVKVSVDAYPGRSFPGQVTYISSQAEFTPKMVQTDQDRTNLVFKVKVTINQYKGLAAGLPADVTFE